MELLWQNGEVVLNSQSSRKQTSPVHKHGQSTTNPNNLIQDFETISWTDCPIDESFEKEFYEDILSGIPSSSNPVDPNKPFGKFDNEKVVNFGASEVDHVSLPLAPPIFDRGLDSVVKNDNFQLPVKKQATSHCASNLVVKDIDMARASSCGIRSKTMSFGVVGKYGRSVSPRYESTDKETIGQAMTSCSGGSGSSFWNQSNETDSRKRKSRDHLEESECRSDATELESAAGNKPSQKSGTSRRSRVAEVHNLSERRRRDRINERMRALQDLIPHSNKSDKASMLDEAIEYMKSLQMQLQLMWMGSGMAPMMVPGMHNYMSRFGMGIGPPPMHPAIQNLMRLSRLPLIDPTVNMAARMNPAPVNYQNQMQISSYLDQYANYMGFHPMPNTSQPMNMFNIGFQSAQQNQALTPPHNGNGSIG